MINGMNWVLLTFVCMAWGMLRVEEEQLLGKII